MKISIRKMDKWMEVLVNIGGHTMDLGLLDAKERAELAEHLRMTADELEEI